jgi:hypothetical protein
MIESPQSFITREECQKAAWEHGYRRPLGEQDGWAAFGSTTARGTLWLAAFRTQGEWLLAVDHPGVIREWQVPQVALPGPGKARYALPNLTTLYAALYRLYQLSVSLPDGPLQNYHAQTAKLPQTTEVERLVVQRIGQDIFRDGLMEYWEGRCPLTGITDPALLRASHIVPWSECTDDSQRLDVHNGLLLSALWDAAFDRLLVTIDEMGRPEFSSRLSPAARTELRWSDLIPLTDLHRENLRWHQYRFKNETDHRHSV